MIFPVENEGCKDFVSQKKAEAEKIFPKKMPGGGGLRGLFHM